MRPEEPATPIPEPARGPALVMLQLNPVNEIRDGPACEIFDQPRRDTHGDAIRLVR